MLNKNPDYNVTTDRTKLHGNTIPLNMSLNLIVKYIFGRMMSIKLLFIS